MLRGHNCWRCFQGFLLFPWVPLSSWSHRFAGIWTTWSFFLISTDNEMVCTFDCGINPCMQEKQFFNTSCKNVNAVFEICFDFTRMLSRRRLLVVGWVNWWITWIVGFVEISIWSIGKYPVHSNERKMSKDFLFYPTLTFRMKILNDKYSFADFVEFLNAPL